MESPIDRLLKKYWSGETTLEEEQIIKAHFRKSEPITTESQYFQYLSELKQEKANPSRPFKIRSKSTWWQVAASLLIGITVALLVLDDARQQRQYVVDDPQEALEITRQALLMVSNNLNDSRTYTKELEKINKAKEIVKN
ncbi:MAG: hypothetical protein KI790_06840 [Cyclobacteriaceae bacterium]|nr:hypothetical protein [Cyclobacteriaceae bacterium HetDA_MAG_MS6]